MKKILFILLVFTIGCKKDKDDPIPESKTGRMEIEYKTEGSEMTLYHAFNNATTIIVQDISSNNYKYDQVIKGDQAWKVSVAPKNCGCKTSVLVKFNGDTLLFKEQTGTTAFGGEGHLPFIK
jgi:hypothetical protein